VFVDGGGILVKKIKCNFRTLGKKFGKLMKSVNAAVIEMSQEQIANLEKNGSIALMVEGTEAVIELADVEIFSEDVPGWTVANEGALTVALDVEVTDELRREGIAREIIKRIQAMRKEQGLEIVDRIAVSLSKNEATDEAVNEFAEHICNQVLADSIEICESLAGEEVDLDGRYFNARKTSRWASIPSKWVVRRRDNTKSKMSSMPMWSKTTSNMVT
jgi:isoleucyl-tRNA synthetase